MHPVVRSCFLLFLYFRFFGYLKCSENSEKIILKISVTEPSGVIKKGRGPPPGSQEVCWRGPTLGRAKDPPDCLVGPLVCPHRLYLPLVRKPLETEPFFAKPSLFRR